MAESIWPHDTYLDPYVSPRPLGELTCFVLSPFQPRGKFDTVFGVIEEVCRRMKDPVDSDDESTEAGRLGRQWPVLSSSA